MSLSDFQRNDFNTNGQHDGDLRNEDLVETIFDTTIQCQPVSRREWKNEQPEEP
jgi:hypothetical protein